MKPTLTLFGMLGLVMLIGCGGDDEAVTEPTPETRLQIQNEEGDRFVSGMLAYESGMRELNATLAQKGYDMATLAALTPETLRNYFFEAETDALFDTIGLYVDTPANDASAAIDALIAQESLLQGSVATEARGGGLILAGLGAITAADILLNCWDEYYAARERCENALQEEWAKNQPSAAINVLHYPTAYAACFALGLEGFNECKESTALNILSSLAAEAVGPFSRSAEGAINIRSAGQSIESIRENGASIYARWNRRCFGEKARAEGDEEWVIIIDNENDTFMLPEGDWDVTLFSDGHIRKETLCVGVSPLNEQNITLETIDGLGSSASSVSSTASSAVVSSPGSNEASSLSSAAASSASSALPETNVLEATIAIPGYHGTFTPESVIFSFGSVSDGDPVYPSILAKSASLLEFDPLKMDMLSLFFDNTLPGPGTYVLNDTAFFEGDAATVAFTTPDILDEDTGTVVVFSDVAGTVTFESYGIHDGDRLKGSFAITVLGRQEICEDTACGSTTDNEITGTITGTFDGILRSSGVLALPPRE